MNSPPVAAVHRVVGSPKAAHQPPRHSNSTSSLNFSLHSSVHHDGNVPINVSNHRLIPIPHTITAPGLDGDALLHSKEQSNNKGYLLTQNVSAVTGQSKILLRPLSSDTQAPQSSAFRGDKKAKLSIRERRELLEYEHNAAFLESQEQWKDQDKVNKHHLYYNSKWENFRSLFLIIDKPAHRFKRSLHLAYQQGTPYVLLKLNDIKRIFCNNFTFDNADNKAVDAHLTHLFMIFDDDFDDLVDWRKLVIHLKVLQQQKIAVRTKLKWMFDLYASFRDDGCILVSDMLDLVLVASVDDHRTTLEGVLFGCLAKFGLAEVNERNDYDVQLEAPVSPSTFDAVVLQNALVLKIVAQHFFERNPDSVRLALIAQQHSAAVRSFEFADGKFKWRAAQRFFLQSVVPNHLRFCWARWLAFRDRKRSVACGTRHFRRQQLALAVAQWDYWLHGRWERREQRQSSVALYRRHLKRRAVTYWKRFVDMQRRLFRFHTKKAKRLYHSHLLEINLKHWRLVTLRQIRVRQFVKKLFGNMALEVLLAWSSYAKREAALRKDMERRDEMRLQILNAEKQEFIDQERAKERAEEELREWKRQQKLLREIEQEHHDAVWDERRQKAQLHTKNIKKIHQQNHTRAVSKKKVVRRERRELETDWEAYLEDAVARARAEAEAFLDTDDGKAQMKVDMENIQDDAANLGAQTTSEGLHQDSDWIKLEDPMFKTLFYYNQKTGEKVESKALSKKEAVSIARSNYVASQIQLARRDVEELRGRELHLFQQNKAARTIQNLWQVRKARRLIVDLIDYVYVKRIDPYTGDAYYYNTASKSSSWSKPVNLGSRDLKLPEWYLFWHEEEEKFFYHNRVSPWLTSETKPAGLMPCSVCLVQLCTRWCVSCGEPYCLDCFENAHASWGKKGNHTWQKREISVVHCVLCKDKVAEKMCKGCHFDCYCAKCFTMTHSKDPKKKKHISYDI